ncbi:TetR/AcrR family transcriptional regulator [Hyphomicrobium sp.]|uniref:TetR/AcrR family transcriptional regulator n=1 Tax=Hyphomicrobium sp. TaxID=82 RepID=UPI002B65D3AC|nr:TetR/AcrR family transcriptional regulator [Hyphomicrobium sp.]HVZ05695.1 TetR/AcrR family transcriptional regulator [Hyphomicrobium sp.]
MHTDTRSALLAEAEILVRTKGYAAFSYADLSDRIGIRKASIHHHFPTKEGLGNALIDSYLDRFTNELDALSAKRADTKSKLLTYGDFFAGSLRDGLMPLCGALAADVAYLPVSMQQRVKKFFEIHTEWLEATLREGVAQDQLHLNSSPRKSALLLLSTLQGASVVAWALKDPSVIRPAFKQSVDSLGK